MSRVLAGTSGYITVTKISLSTIGTPAAHTACGSQRIEVLALANGKLLSYWTP
jgi:hypothetical protein